MDKNLFLLLALVVFVVMVKPQVVDRNKPAIEYEYELTETGYHFRYKTDESERLEEGTIDRSKGKNAVLAVSGFYSYVGDDGKMYKVSFVADENGYRPEVQSGGGAGLNTNSNVERRLPLKPYLGSAVLASLTGGGIG